MKKNNLGFSLIELLAAITILGVIMGGAVIGVSRYLDRARNQSYESMEKGAYEAAQSYILDQNIILAKGSSMTIPFDVLIDELYLEKPLDPAVKNGSVCKGSVDVSNPLSSGELDNYQYHVLLKCSHHESEVDFPKK